MLYKYKINNYNFLNIVNGLIYLNKIFRYRNKRINLGVLIIKLVEYYSKWVFIG